MSGRFREFCGPDCIYYNIDCNGERCSKYGDTIVNEGDACLAQDELSVLGVDDWE